MSWQKDAVKYLDEAKDLILDEAPHHRMFNGHLLDEVLEPIADAREMLQEHFPEETLTVAFVDKKLTELFGDENLIPPVISAAVKNSLLEVGRMEKGVVKVLTEEDLKVLRTMGVEK